MGGPCKTKIYKKQIYNECLLRTVDNKNIASEFLVLINMSILIFVQNLPCPVVGT